MLKEYANMWTGHCVNYQKSVHCIKNVVHTPIEPVKGVTEWYPLWRL